MYAFDEIKKADSEIADAIQAEMERQNSHLELIASVSYTHLTLPTILRV